MIYPYLGSKKDLVDRMCGRAAEASPTDASPRDGETVRISNPMSESFEYLRSSILPNLLGSESVSSRAPYPHRLFEVGKVVYKNPLENYGVSTRQRIAFLLAHAEADYNEAASQVATAMYFLGKDYSIAEADDSRFITGRQARVIYKGDPVGIFGELHPRVLEAWSIAMPCAAAEIDLESLLD